MAISISKPHAGQQAAIQARAGETIELNFTPDQAFPERVGDDLVFRFEDGSVSTISGFFTDLTRDALPDFVLPDETVLSGEDFFTAINPDLLPAAGGSTGGSGAYDDNAGALVDGLSALDPLDPNFWDNGAELPPMAEGLDVAELPELPELGPLADDPTGDLPPQPPVPPVIPPVEPEESADELHAHPNVGELEFTPGESYASEADDSFHFDNLAADQDADVIYDFQLNGDKIRIEDLFGDSDANSLDALLNAARFDNEADTLTIEHNKQTLEAKFGENSVELTVSDGEAEQNITVFFDSASDYSAPTDADAAMQIVQAMIKEGAI